MSSKIEKKKIFEKKKEESEVKIRSIVDNEMEKEVQKFLEDPFIFREKGSLNNSKSKDNTEKFEFTDDTSFEKTDKSFSKNFMNGTDKFNVEEDDETVLERQKISFEDLKIFENLVKIFNLDEKSEKNVKILKINSVVFSSISSFNLMISSILSSTILNMMVNFLTKNGKDNNDILFNNLNLLAKELPIEENLKEIFYLALKKFQNQVIDFIQKTKTKEESHNFDKKIEGIVQKKYLKFFNSFLENFNSEETIEIFNLMAKDLILKGPLIPFYHNSKEKNEEIRELRVQILREIELLEIRFKEKEGNGDYSSVIEIIKNISKMMNLILYGKNSSFDQILKISVSENSKIENLENLSKGNTNYFPISILTRGVIGSNQNLKSLEMFLIYSKKKIENLKNFEILEAKPEEDDPKTKIEILKPLPTVDNMFLTVEGKKDNLSEKNFMSGNESTKTTRKQNEEEILLIRPKNIFEENIQNITISNWNPQIASQSSINQEKKSQRNPLKRRLKSKRKTSKNSTTIQENQKTSFLDNKSNLTTNCTEKVNIKDFLRSKKTSINNYNIEILGSSQRNSTFESKISEINIEKFKKIYNTKKKKSNNYAFNSTGANNPQNNLNENSHLFSAPSRGIINLASKNEVKMNFGSFFQSKIESQFTQNVDNRSPNMSNQRENSQNSLNSEKMNLQKNPQNLIPQSSFLQNKLHLKSVSETSGKRSFKIRKEESVNRINKVKKTGLGGIVISKTSQRGITSRQKLLKINQEIHGNSKNRYEKNKNISFFNQNNSEFSDHFGSRNISVNRKHHNESVLSRGMSLNKFKNKGNPLKKRLRFSSRNDIDVEDLTFQGQTNQPGKHQRSFSAKNLEKFSSKFFQNNEYFVKKMRESKHRRPKSVMIGQENFNFFNKNEENKRAFNFIIEGVENLVQRMQENNEEIGSLRLERKAYE